MKSKAVLFLALLTPMAYGAMIAHYNMEQTTSPIVDQAGGQTAAAVDAGHQYSVTGPAGFGNAVGLNANGSWQISPTDAAELSLANNFTVAAWVYRDSAVIASKPPNGPGVNSNNDRIIGHDAAWEATGWSFGIRDGRLLFTKNGVIDAFDPSGTTVPTDQWVHVAAVVDGTSGVSFYIDAGVSGVNGNTANLNPLDGNDPYGIGRSYGAGEAQWFAGNLDDVKVFDTPLSQSEIAGLMVPEPSATALLGLGGLALAFRRRK